MDTKAAFERWWQEGSGQADICAGSNIGSTIKMIAFDAWQASRAAIEIELPNKITGTLLHGRVIANEMLHDCQKAITSHGIRIKGKTE